MNAEAATADNAGARSLRCWSGPTPVVICALAGVMATACLVALGVSISTTYHATASYHYDSAAYRFHSVGIYDQFAQQGRWATAWSLLQQQNSFDLLVRLFAYPESLCQFHGHLLVQAPLMAVFFFLTFWYVYARSGSYLLGGSVIAVAFLFGPVYHPIQSLTDYWKDNLGIWMLGSALWCWFFSEHASRRGWAFLSGVFWGLLVVQRPVLTIYGGALFAPFFIYGVYRRIREDHFGTFVRQAAAFGAFPLAALLLVIVAQGTAIYHYYFVIGYDYSSPSEVADWLLRHPFSNGRAFRVGLMASFVVCVIAALRQGHAGLADVLGSFWLSAGFLALLVATRANFHHFAVVLMVLTVVALARMASRPSPKLWTRGIAAALLLISAGGSYVQFRHYAMVRHIDAQARGQFRAIFAEIAELAQTATPPPKFGVFFNDCYCLIWNQLYFDHGIKLAQESFYMSVHDPFYRGRYGDVSEAAIAATIIDEMVQANSALIVIHQNPQDLTRFLQTRSHSAHGKSLALEVNRLIGEHLAQSNHWQIVKRIESRRAGDLLIYRNIPRALAAR